MSGNARMYQEVRMPDNTPGKGLLCLCRSSPSKKASKDWLRGSPKFAVLTKDLLSIACLCLACSVLRLSIDSLWITKSDEVCAPYCNQFSFDEAYAKLRSLRSFFSPELSVLIEWKDRLDLITFLPSSWWVDLLCTFLIAFVLDRAVGWYHDLDGKVRACAMCSN